MELENLVNCKDHMWCLPKNECQVIVRPHWIHQLVNCRASNFLTSLITCLFWLSQTIIFSQTFCITILVSLWIQDHLPSKKCKTLSKRMRKMQELEKQLQEKEFERAFYREFWPDNVWLRTCHYFSLMIWSLYRTGICIVSQSVSHSSFRKSSIAKN